MLNPSPTELSTAATDGVLAVLALALAASIARTPASTRRTIWISVLVLLAAGSCLGTLAHGLDLEGATRERLWGPIYLSLGLTVALFFVGAWRDWRGDAAARTALPWAIAAGVTFFVVTRLSSGSFLLFIAYEALAVLATLAIYLHLWRSNTLPGAGLIAAGVALTLAAAAVQVSSLHLTIVWPLDHNGLFHLVQMAALVVIALGLRAGARRETGTDARV